MTEAAPLHYQVAYEGAAWFPSRPGLRASDSVGHGEAFTPHLETAIEYIHPPPIATLSHTDRRTIPLSRK